MGGDTVNAEMKQNNSNKIEKAMALSHYIMQSRHLPGKMPEIRCFLLVISEAEIKDYVDLL